MKPSKHEPNRTSLSNLIGQLTQLSRPEYDQHSLHVVQVVLQIIKHQVNPNRSIGDGELGVIGRESQLVFECLRHNVDVESDVAYLLDYGEGCARDG